MSERRLRIGWPAAAQPLVAIAHLFLVGWPLAGLSSVEPDVYIQGAAISGGVGLLLLALSILLLVRISQTAQGTAGRARLTLCAGSAIAVVVAELAMLAVLGLAATERDAVTSSLLFTDEGDAAERMQTVVDTLLTISATQGTDRVLVVAAGVWAFARIALILGLIASWFVVPERVRRILWWIVDVPVLAAFVFALYALPFTPRSEEPGAAVLPGIAIAIATVFGLRFTARVGPYLLDAVERIGFQSLVAARMLRSRKSSFLSMIGVLSVLAVTVSSCMLSTVLSVMGGFREDLREKILGSHAHVVVDREYGTIGEWTPILERVRAVPGVTGASPYLAGEVMLSSASNLGGAVLRGIDPATIGDVTDLPRDMTFGDLDYLVHPERLLELPPDQMSGSLLTPRRRSEIEDEDWARLLGTDTLGTGVDAGTRAVDAGVAALPPPLELPQRRDAPVRDPGTASLLGELDRALGELDDERGQGSPPRPLTGETPPPRTEVTPPREASQIAAELEEFLLPQEEISPDSPLADPGARDAVSTRDVLPGLVVGQELARSLRLHVGDEVNVVSPLGDLGPTGPVPRSRPFRVAGIFYSGMYEYDMQMVYTDLETAQRFLRAEGVVTGIEVRVDDWERAPDRATRIAAAMGDMPIAGAGAEHLRVRSWQEVNRNLFGALELEKLSMFIVLGIAILVASFCIVATLLLMVQEKGREVGILKAMGTDDRTVVVIFLLQGLLTGLSGALSGLGLGWVACFAVEHLGVIPLDPEVYYIDRLPVHVDPIEFVLVGVAAVIVCVLATIYPAILASRLRPVDALRNT